MYGRPGWRDSYVRRLVGSDAICAALAAAVGHATAFGFSGAATMPAAAGIAILLPAVWVFAMSAARTYEHRFLWEGSDEFRRVLRAGPPAQRLPGLRLYCSIGQRSVG